MDNKQNKIKNSFHTKKKNGIGKFSLEDTLIYKFWLSSEKALIHIKTIFTTLN